MQTTFTDIQLKDKENKSSEKIIRKCVHCGMCNATCPTYQINGDELDGKDEALVPLDYETNGLILDDDLHSNLVMKLPQSCKLIAFFDACHSGTIMDLPYRYIGNRKSMIECKKINPKYLPLIVMVSGCQDNQTSADAYGIQGNKWSGAMTSVFLDILKKRDYNITCSDLLKKMKKQLK